MRVRSEVSGREFELGEFVGELAEETFTPREPRARYEVYWEEDRIAISCTLLTDPELEFWVARYTQLSSDNSSKD